MDVTGSIANGGRTAALMAPFPEELVESRQGGGGNFRYVAGENVIRRLIDATDNTFSVEVKSIERMEWHDRTNKKTGELISSQTLWIARVAVTIPGLGTREHVGVQLVDDFSGEDVIKGAITDALKKAATLFGVGLELYDNKPNRSDGGNQSNGNRKPRFDLNTWRPHVTEVFASKEPARLNGLIADAIAVENIGAWIAMIQLSPSTRNLDFLVDAAAKAKVDSTALDRYVKARRKELEIETGQPSGK